MTKQQFLPKTVVAKTENHADYIRSMIENVVTVGIGPAGTGKTFISVYQAVQMLRDEHSRINRIIITRPIVEAVESMGFLPGELEHKAAPYMEPIMDAMSDFASSEEISEWKKNKQIRVCPLGFLRGKTFHNSLMILDEAQNTTFGGLKLFISRLGRNSKVIVNGDPDQSDIGDSGLCTFADKLRNRPDVGVIDFNGQDIMRSKHLSRILGYLA